MNRKIIHGFEPSFVGKHNHVRTRTWLLLFDRRLARGRGLMLRELALQSGTDYKSLSVLLGRWVRWGYVGYRTTPKGRIYYLLNRGERWLQRWWHLAPIEMCLAELGHVRRDIESRRIDNIQA